MRNTVYVVGTYITPLVAALVGGYVFTWGFTVAGITLLVMLGSSFHTAETAMLLLAFPVFLAIFLAGFTCLYPVRAWLEQLLAGTVMTVAAQVLQARLLY